MADEELCDIMWQHEHNKKWVNYSSEELAVLNKAFRRNQKSVTLPSSNPKKQLVINFEQMYQKNKITSYEQRIRCAVQSDQYYVWLWEGDEEEWNSYTPRLALYLEIAYQKKQNKLHFYSRNDYEIDLENFIQINTETGYSRTVKREQVEVLAHSSQSTFTFLNISISCQKFISKMAEEGDESVHKIIFELPASAPANTSFSQPIQGNSQVKNLVNTLVASVDEKASQITTLIPVDSECEEHANYHLYCEHDVVFNATLNLTSLQNNNNKFFIIQLLEHNKKKQYSVWFRWGRVGNRGQTNLLKFGSNLSDAKMAFEKKFFDKTRNSWQDKSNFQQVQGKYDYLLMDLSPDIGAKITISSVSKLDLKVQSLMEMICNQKNMEDLMKDMSYDSKKTPLGKLTGKQILDGYVALNNIANIIVANGKGSQLVNACNEFYTKIPHSFGRKIPPVIQTQDEVQEKLKMLEALQNINIAMDAMNENDDGNHPIDKYYKSLKCDLDPLSDTSDEFIAVQKCILETHGPTHATYKMEIVDVFKCGKEESSPFLNCGNNLLLWHGSRIANWFGILKKGLQIAPPEAPSSGYMFGKGIYFADVSSKSANYCFATKKKNEGLILLSEVSVGKQLSLYHSEDMPRQLKDYNSVYGIGQFKPSSFKKTVLSPEARLPVGPLVEDAKGGAFSLYYNEYIVYDIRQVKMKYLVRIKFNFI